MLQENDGQALQKAGEVVLQALTQYLEESHAGKGLVVQYPLIQHLRDELRLDDYIRQGGLDLPSFHAWLKTYLRHSMHMHHPHYIGHQVAVPHIASGLSDFIHGIIGNPMSIYEMGPAAASVEQAVVDWMLEKVGWSQTGAGVITGGGSVANLHALLAARAAIAPESWNEGNPTDLVVLCPQNAHYCIGRAVSIMGLGQQSIRFIDTDRNEVIKSDSLLNLITQVKEEEKRVMAVVANACATSTGLYDPIDEIAEICSAENIWFHLDSPHGATALLSVKYRHYFKGIEKADSMVWDAHKMMRTSPLCTGVLFKHQNHLMQTFSQKASYLIHEKQNPGVDVLAYQIECTKAALATKLFLVLAVMGENGLGDWLAKIYDRSKGFAHLIHRRAGFNSPFPVHANIVCFQYRPDEFDQLKLRNKIVKAGKFYITSTEIHGQRYLRLTIMNLATTNETINELLLHIESIADG